MRKKILAMLLAAVMVMALLPTAFAADEDAVPPGSVQVGVRDDEALAALRMPEGTVYTLRNWDVGGNWPYTLTKGEPEDFTPEFSFALPLGVNLTITAAAQNDEYNTTFMTNILITAWSDPDRDGVYDQRIAVLKEETGEVDGTPVVWNWMELLPTSEEGPIETGTYDERFVPAHSSYIDAADISDTHELEAPGHDTVVWGVPATVQYTSDYLTEYFGANTLLQIIVYAGDDAEYEYYLYYFLLTGEQVDPDLMDEPAEPTEPTEPTEPAEPTEPSEPETPEITFNDVPADSWYASAVSFAAERGLIQGDGKGNFNPNGNLAREQTFAILARLDGKLITGDNWSETATQWAMTNNVSTGENPSADVTREQLVVMLWRYKGEPGADTSKLSGYPDRAYLHDWAETAMAWAVNTGIIEGSDGWLNPLATATRAEAATIFQRYCGN